MDGVLGQENARNVPVQQLRLPPFSEERPDLWFLQVEAVFSLSRVVDDHTKFYSVISLLQPQHLSQFHSVIREGPTGDDAYGRLKKVIIERFAESESTRLRKLLSELQLGDKRPSRLLEEMMELAGSKIHESVVDQIWRQRLPQSVQEILSASSETTGIHELARIADRIREVESQKTESAIQAVTATDASNTLLAAVTALTDMVARLNNVNMVQERRNSASRGASRGRSRHRGGPTSSSRGVSANRSARYFDEQSRPICWYHNFHRERAHRCVSPCFFRKASPKERPK